MPDNPDERLFDEEDVAEILQRASEKQSSRKIRQSGLTLEELKQIAVEAGIDPRYVTDAVREMSDSRIMGEMSGGVSAPDTPNFWGGPLSVTRECVVDGTIDDFAWEEIVSEARREFGDTGLVRQWNSSREWASSVNSARSHVALTTRGGKTRLQLFWNNPGYAPIAWVPMLVVSILSLPIVFQALALTGLAAAMAILSIVILAFTGARWVTTLIARHQQLRIDRLLGRLGQIARLRAAPPPEIADTATRLKQDSSTRAPTAEPSQSIQPADSPDEWDLRDEGQPRTDRRKTR